MSGGGLKVGQLNHYAGSMNLRGKNSIGKAQMNMGMSNYAGRKAPTTPVVMPAPSAGGESEDDKYARCGALASDAEVLQCLGEAL